MDNPQCPWCGSSSTSAEFVENENGDEQQVSPFECADCQAQQFSRHDEEYLANTSPQERELGWWKGWAERFFEEPRLPDERPRVKCRDCIHTGNAEKDRDRRFEQARKDFEAQAKRILDTNAQQERVIITLRNQMQNAYSEAGGRWNDERQGLFQRIYAAENEARAAKATLETAQAELKKAQDELKQLQDAHAHKPPTGGGSRFSWLEVD